MDTNIAISSSVGKGLISKTPHPAPAPFIKWVGGKKQLIPQLIPLLPPGVELRRHVEPFVGGAALFFSLQPQKALLSDVNRALVETYCTVRDQVEEIIPYLRQLARNHSAENYYRIRTRYNGNRKQRPAQRAAMFIYLNKTCFNGLHRVNRKGDFNVPAGRYKNPRILDVERLRRASQQLQSAQLICDDFETILINTHPGDFIYFDPPYEPVSSTANFTSYAQHGFTRRDQIRLRDLYTELDRHGCKLMLSNSDVPYIRELYKKFRIDRVAALRAVNCDATNRGRVSEVVIRNY